MSRTQLRRHVVLAAAPARGSLFWNAALVFILGLSAVTFAAGQGWFPR